jgi:carbamoyl-phosphate synthase small subunit
VRETVDMKGLELADEVTTTEPYVVPAVVTTGSTDAGPRFRVAAVDLGIKANTPRMMAERGIEVHVLPATSTIDDVLAVQPDGLFFSNGPGDPAATTQQVELLREALERGIPYFGICFGNQLFGRALGLGTFKLKYGHRGINQPVMDRTTGKVEVTAHNHGFAVDAPLDRPTETPYGVVTVSHVCLNDDVVEGLELRSAEGDLLSFSVQYHPEAAAGPHDAAYLFDRFCDLMVSRGSAPASRLEADTGAGNHPLRSSVAPGGPVPSTPAPVPSSSPAAPAAPHEPSSAAPAAPVEQEG